MRIIRNYDVSSYYPHLMTLYGYTSRNIPSPEVFSNVLEERMKAKKSGDKDKANALKLVVNTTYGASLSPYNSLYDPLMGRSVCITGQLFLLELAEHLYHDIPDLRVVQLNTDGIMVEFDDTLYPEVQAIVDEWQTRTGFELEEDKIKQLIQKDVNGYIEVQEDGSKKVKGGILVRGIAPAGAFNINNNAPIVSKAIVDYLVDGTSPEYTINQSDKILDFQLIAKVGSKYSQVYQLYDNDTKSIPVQKCNRVYASKDPYYGRLYKVHALTGSTAKVAGLPKHCIIDNNNQLDISEIDRRWYIKLAEKYIKDFLGIKPPRRNTRKINSLKKKSLSLFD